MRTHTLFPALLACLSAGTLVSAQGVPVFDGRLFAEWEALLGQGEQDLALQRD